VSCKYDGEFCVEHRKLINNKISASKSLFLNKDYQQAIGELKIAFENAEGLTLPTCLKCAGFFRLTIYKSLENIHDDLKKMSTGIWGSRKFKPSFLLASSTLEELKKRL
jgi:hypothetical protein